MNKAKQPYAIGLKNGDPIAFAGLWGRWKNKMTGQPLETYTIITTDPNELIKPEQVPTLHDRMPVNLAKDNRRHRKAS